MNMIMDIVLDTSLDCLKMSAVFVGGIFTN